jgi:hypothetical protein
MAESLEQGRFDAFVKFYREHRDNVQLSERKRWDEMTSKLEAPRDFYWTRERMGGYIQMDVGWACNNGRYRMQFPLYEVMYHKWTGTEALGHLAELGDKLEELNPELGNAMVLLVDYEADVSDLVLWYDLDQISGKLIRFKAIRKGGLLQVKAHVEE